MTETKTDRLFTVQDRNQGNRKGTCDLIRVIISSVLNPTVVLGGTTRTYLDIKCPSPLR